MMSQLTVQHCKYTFHCLRSACQKYTNIHIPYNPICHCPVPWFPARLRSLPKQINHLSVSGDDSAQGKNQSCPDYETMDVQYPPSYYMTWRQIMSRPCYTWHTLPMHIISAVPLIPWPGSVGSRLVSYGVPWYVLLLVFRSTIHRSN